MKISVKYNKKLVSYLLVYTAVFLILYYFCFGQWFNVYDKTLFRSYDGLDQHFLIFLYIGKLGRQFFEDLIVNHKIVFPLWNMGIGYGADILTSIGAYLPDPFNWISVFVSEKHAETAYAFSIILKLYVSGLAFSYFAFEKKLGRSQAMIGSIIYVFSGTSLIFFVEPFLVNPMYLFPFVIIGIDKLWEDQKHFKLYVASVCLIFINYFYFGYMTTIFVVGYCVLKFVFSQKEERKLCNLVKLINRFFWHSLLAVGLSMVVLLPIILVVINASRIGADFYVPQLFEQWYYSGLIAGFTTSFNMLGRDCNIGYGVISIPCITMLFLKKHKYAMIKTEFILLSIGLCIPYFGKIMNGFGYTANRWVWAYALLVAYIIALATPYFKKITFEQGIAIAVVSLGYLIVVCAVYNNHSSMTTAAALVLLLVTLILVNICDLSERVYQVVCVSLAAISVFTTNYYAFHEKHGNMLNEWIQKGSGLDLLYDNGVNELLKKLGARPSERYDKYGFSTTRNVSWLYGISGMDFYISIYNDNIDKFHNDISLLTSSAPMEYCGLDRRSDLDYLMGVKHFLIPSDWVRLLPTGYNILEAEVFIPNGNYQAYTTEYENSFVHGLDELISKEEYYLYTPYERQQLIMRAGVVDSVEDLGGEKLQLPDDEIAYQISGLDGVTWNGDSFDVVNGGGTVILDLDDVYEKELYILLDDIDYENGNDNNFQVNLQAMYNEENVPGISHGATFTNCRSHMYGGRHTWMFNLGRADHIVNRIAIRFPKGGHYLIDQIRVYGEPFDRIEQNINNLPSLTNNLVVDNNSISFDLNSTDNKYMLVSIPYSPGWKAYVDGKERKIQLCDGAFMLLGLESDDHHVVLKYRTPGLLLGSVITLISLMVFYLSTMKEKTKFFSLKKKKIEETH